MNGADATGHWHRLLGTDSGQSLEPGLSCVRRALEAMGHDRDGA